MAVLLRRRRYPGRTRLLPLVISQTREREAEAQDVKATYEIQPDHRLLRRCGSPARIDRAPIPTSEVHVAGAGWNGRGFLPLGLLGDQGLGGDQERSDRS